MPRNGHDKKEPFDPVNERKYEDDARLVERVTAGDRTAKIELAKRLRRQVERRVCYLSPFYAEVEDLTQEVMLEIFLSAPRYQADGCIEAWADAITVRTVLKKLKQIFRRRRVFTFTDADIEPAKTDIEQDVLRKARSERISAILRGLPPEQSMAMVLKLVHGYSLKEVASLMDRRIESVRYLLRKGCRNASRLAAKDKCAMELFFRSGR
jgi:RNA polymerase sigma-70 factor (ECF subfamily)